MGSVTFMRGLFSNIQFAKPLFLWLGLALPLIWFRFRDRRPAIILWRSLIILLLILTLADPQAVNEQTKDRERIFAFDLSASISPNMRRWMEKSTNGNFAPNRYDHVFVFGAESAETSNWRDSVTGTSPPPSTIHPEKTNLENLVNKILSLPSAPRSLFLFTDGWETQGSIEHLLPAAAGTGLKIYPMLPPEGPKVANVAITKLLSPTYGTSGETVNLKVVLDNQNDKTVDGTLTITKDGQTLKTESVMLKPGSQIFAYQTTLSEGVRNAYRAKFIPTSPESDKYAPDNQAQTWVTVRTKAKVLLLNGQAGGGRYLEEVLKRKGFEVTSRTADAAPLPTGYAVVIFNNVGREKFSANYLAALERHVAQGNGFFMLGSEASFAPGSYQRTPIESMLPVVPKEQKREERNRAVVLVIDKSGSMRDDNRILFAQEAAKVVARQLKDNDLLGVVGFDVSAFIVVPMEAVGRQRGRIEAQIDRLRPGGQTYFYPALLEAKRQLEKQNASSKNVILLSDGETRGSQGELIDLVTAMKNEMKITVSAVAIGADADVRIMKRISQYGGGLFHHTLDPTTLPQIVLQQIQDKPRDEPQGEKDLSPVQDHSSELLASFATRTYPPVRGYMETELKRGAQLDLMIPREDHKAPLLASWRYNRGKVVALTTDLEGRWTRSWIQWNEFQNFLAKIIDWLRPGEEAIPLHEARVSLAGNQPVIDLFAYEDASLDSQFRFSISGKTGRSQGTLKKLAPGHYQANLPVSAQGDYQIELSEERHGRSIPLPPVSYTLPYDLQSELPRPEFNTSLLARVAQMTGGEVNPKSPEAMRKQDITMTARPLRQPLMIIAGLLFLLELGFRKLILSEPD